MLHEMLKSATGEHHDQLEQLMYVGQIMDNSLTVDQYHHLLNTNYLVHQVFEANIYNALSDDIKLKLSIENRSKLDALKKDLEELKAGQPALPDPGKLNKIPAGNGSLLGAMYVLEGATLGGNMIVKRLKTNANLAPLGLNYYYYQVYGDKLVENWKTFVSVLNSDVPADDYNQAILSAQAMFENIKLLQNGASSLK